MSDDLNAYPDLEVLELRRKIKEYELELIKLRALIAKHRIEDGEQAASDAEIICATQILLYKELAKKGLLDTESTKNFDIYHKNLMLAQGKAVPQDDKKKKKVEKPDIAKLLAIVNGKIE